MELTAHLGSMLPNRKAAELLAEFLPVEPTESHQTVRKRPFVMLRDSKNSHPGNKLWGDGWGWSWFDQGNPLKTTSTDYKVDCQPCHLPAWASEWVYVSGYLPLKR